MSSELLDSREPIGSRGAILTPQPLPPAIRSRAVWTVMDNAHDTADAHTLLDKLGLDPHEAQR